MSYSKSTDFLHLPQYSEMDVLNVLSDFNKAMYNIDVGVSTIHMIVNNVLLKGNLTDEEVQELKTRVDTLSEKSEALEATLNALSSNLEQFENSTNTNLENMNNAILKCATEKQLEERFELLMAENSALRSNLESVEELSNANNTKIQRLNSYVPEFTHTTNVSYSVNTASENIISNPDIKIETSTYGMYRKHDIYFSFDYSTTQEITHNMELGFADIAPIHDLLYNNDFIGKCTVTATGYTSGGNVMPMSANIGVRRGKLVIIFTDTDNRYLPNNSNSHITVHISGFTVRSDI
jgi:hypothetical protein